MARKSQQPTMNEQDLVDFAVGICDAMIGLCLALCDKGIIDRASIARAMEQVLSQQRQRDEIGRAHV